MTSKLRISAVQPVAGAIRRGHAYQRFQALDVDQQSFVIGC
jgi:hypothetical protein